MGKASLFLKLYRKRFPENVILFFLFSLLGTVVSMVLFVQKNHTSLFKNQLIQSGFDGGVEGFSLAYQSAENILGIIAIAAILIGAIGGVSLIGFRNQSSEKAMVMMQIYGMQKADLAIKAAIDAVFYAVLSTCIGFGCGYLLFLHFSKNILHAEVVLPIVSTQTIVLFFETLGLITMIVFMSNLYVDLKLTEKSVSQFLYQRKGKGEGYHHICILIAEILGVLLYASFVFHARKKDLWISGIMVGCLAVVLFAIFHFFFGVFIKKRRKKKKIANEKDLSFCFLCSRNRRDAVLSMVISVGTILICLIANIEFNISGMLRSAYRDHMGYTILVRVDEFTEKEGIKKRLDEKGIPYTYGYSKLEDYSMLNRMRAQEGKFWALVIESQTDHNRHFSVPKGNILAEDYFASRCGLSPGSTTDIFGEDIRYLGELKENQYLSLVNYSFIVNREDWEFGIDDSWSAIFFIDAAESEEEKLEDLTKDLNCHIESASKLIDELKGLVSNYLDILVLVAGMLLIVTVTIFYTVIRSDLTNRRTEMYLYRVFGASFHKAQKVIFYEYTIIALITSFAVSFTIMLCGELYFYYGLKKHFPLSIPIIIMTTAIVVLFIFLCCQMAGLENLKRTGLEAVRDE